MSILTNEERSLRRIECYPPIKYSLLIKGYKEINEIETKGEAVKVIIKNFFDNMPKDQKEQILSRVSKNGY